MTREITHIEKDGFFCRILKKKINSIEAVSVLDMLSNSNLEKHDIGMKF